MGNFPAREQAHLLRSVCGVSRARYHARLGIPTSPFAVRAFVVRARAFVADPPREQPRRRVRAYPTPSRLHERRRDRARPEAPTSRSARNAARASVSAKNDPDARGRSRSRQYARARPSADRSRARAARGSGVKASRANPVLERSASRFISETRSEVDSQQLERRGSVSSMIDSWCAFFQRLVARRASLLRFRRGFRVAFDQDRSVATADRAPPRTLARDGTRTGPEDRASFAISRSRARARAPPSPPPPPPARRLSRAPP